MSRKPKAARPAPSDAPKPPPELSFAALGEWNRVVAMLQPTGILAAVDVDALTIYCQSFAVFRECQIELDKEGTVVIGTTGTPIKNPYLSVQKDAWERMRTLLTEFGMTPAARGKVKTKPADAPKLVT